MPKKYSHILWTQELSNKGFRLTKPREAILKVLQKNTDHPSAEDIYMAVHKFYPEIGLTTVYRNLEFLVTHGIISKFDFGHGKSRYELSEEYSPLGHHHHMVCTKCTKIINYSDFMNEEVEFLKRTERGLSRKYRFKINGHVIHFWGLCQDCQKD